MRTRDGDVRHSDLDPGWRPGELLAGLSDGDLSCVRACLGARTVVRGRGEDVIAAPGPERMIGVVLDGTVIESRGREDGSQLVVDVIRDGGLFGDAGAPGTDGDLRRVVAAGPCTAMIMDASRLVEGSSACSVRPRVLDNFVRSILGRERRLRAHLDLVARRSLRERLRHYLEDERALSDAEWFTIPLSRAQLAEFLHADRTALSRELSRMRSEELVEFDRSTFRLPRRTRATGLIERAG